MCGADADGAFVGVGVERVYTEDRTDGIHERVYVLIDPLLSSSIEPW